MSVPTSRTVSRAAARFRVDCGHDGNYLISWSRNISADGMFVCTKAPVPVGTVLQLVFSVGGLHEVSVAARVIWVGLPGTAAEPGMGLCFLDPPPALREAVLDLVHRVAILNQDGGAPAECPVEPLSRVPPAGDGPSRKRRLQS